VVGGVLFECKGWRNARERDQSMELESRMIAANGPGGGVAGERRVDGTSI